MSSVLPLRLFTAKELENEKTLVISLMDMVNDAYALQELEGSISRFKDSDEIWKDLGDDGLCAVVQDPDNGDLPVAMACAKRWTKCGGTACEPEATGDWEIGPAASRNDPRYRKKGLVDRCLNVLYDALLDRSGAKTLTLWMKVVENLVADFWRKKGFAQVGPRWIIPRGEWHRDQEFILIDMCKVVSRSAVDIVPANNR